jgi:hypothetical protein
MKTFHLLLIVIGFFLMPLITYACGSHSDCCVKKNPATTEKMDCCKNADHSKNKAPESCNGNCGHSNCVTASNYGVAFFEIRFKINNFDFLEKKQNYFNIKTKLSYGFYSLWLIPKIG